MKTVKRTIGIILAMVMTMMFTTSVFAAEVKLDGRNFEAYQIFTGKQADGPDANGNIPELCDIQWGSAFATDEAVENLLAALKTTDSTSYYFECTTAEDVAEKLSKFKNDEQKLKDFAKIADNYKIAGSAISLGEYGSLTTDVLAPGYYLVVDTSTTNGQLDTAKNLSLLQMTKNGAFEVKVKTDIPMVEKKVKEESYTGTDKTTTIGYQLEKGYNDVADYDIGDAVPFMLIGTMPTTLSDYPTYKYIFHDEQSAGLTLNVDSIKVYHVADKAATVKTLVKNTETEKFYVVEKTAKGFKVSFDDVKSIKDEMGNAITVTKDSIIVVEYEAVLNNNAVVGLEGNPNEVCLEYSNNPNFVGEGTPGDDGDNNEENETGKTEVDKVIVFTYELDVTKVDGDDNSIKLENAQFYLQKGNMYYCLDSEGNVYWNADQNKAEVLSSNASGLFIVKGLDEGDYTLTETVAPTGYNLLKDAISLTIKAVTYNGQDWTTFKASDALTNVTLTVNGNDSASTDSAEENINTSGVVNLTVKNNKGTLLPETGGVGTVAFYVIGGLLVTVAVVLLVTRKRMSK